MFNPNLKSEWFTAVMQVINNITMLVILTGAALIREREHGTIEHLLVDAGDTERNHGLEDLGERTRDRSWPRSSR